MFKLFLRSISSLFTILDVSFKKKFIGILVLILVTGLFDTLGLAAIIPAISLIFEPNFIEKSDILLKLFEFSGLKSHAEFGIAVFCLTVLIFVFRSFFVMVSVYFQQKFGFDVVLFLVNKAFKYLFNNEKYYLLEQDADRGVRDLMISPQHLNTFLLAPILLIGSEIFVFIFLISGIIFFNYKVFLIIVFTIVPFSGLFYLIIKRRIIAWSNLRLKLSGKVFGLGFQYITGYVEILLKNKQSYFQKKFLYEFERLFKIDFKNGIVQIIPAKIFEIMSIVGLLIIVVYSFYVPGEAKNLMPLALLYMAAAYRIIPSLSKITSAVVTLEQSQPLIKVYQELFALPLEKSANDSAYELSFKQKIEYRQVTFGFNNVSLFDNFNLTIQKGSATALVGPSGSGKTTLINLLLGFKKPSSGSVFIDDEKLTSENLANLRSRIGYVQQSVFILNSTIKENVAIGDDQIDEERVKWAMDQASLKEFYLSKEEGLDYHIKEFGKNLSGGQRQRISIARALYNNADILILDEATSALDEITENEIIESLKTLKQQGITIIVIAHQSKILTICDNVVNLSPKS